MGTSAPCSGRFAALTKSPLTKIILASSCGGTFGMAYKTAGFDGLLITGKSQTPIYLQIDEIQVKFIDASHLWGKGTDEAQELFELDKNSGEKIKKKYNTKPNTCKPCSIGCGHKGTCAHLMQPTNQAAARRLESLILNI